MHIGRIDICANKAAARSCCAVRNSKITILAEIQIVGAQLNNGVGSAGKRQVTVKSCV